MIRPAEVFPAERTGEGVPGSESPALVPRVSGEGGPRAVPAAAHHAPKAQFPWGAGLRSPGTRCCYLHAAP
ncbi:hypothetical protein KQX54_003706 [Cotesia glomerata]|uniref:Uncharacterized protein n=1 Tax=Cotesia glomerata TaxID=32391 RepID=A0AAV7IMW6_COTGL|nr:hypothetical protein KQX54_003706 [Cotesia glomerata]